MHNTAELINLTEDLLERAPMRVDLESRLQAGEKPHPYSCLVKGMVFQGYSSICTALMEKEKTGKAKQEQLAKWEIYFSWEKQGHKFVIQKVFKSPLQWELIDRLTMRHVYKVLLISTLYPLLAACPARQGIVGAPGQVYGVEVRKIFYWFGIVNEKGCEKFVQKKYGPVEKEFFTVLKSKNYAALVSVIEELRDKFYLSTDHRYKVHIEGEFKPVITSFEQTAEIDRVIRSVMNSLGCETVQEIFTHRLSEKFYSKIQEELYNFGKIKYFEKCFNFAGVPEHLYNYFYSLEGANISLEVLLQHCKQQTVKKIQSHAESKWKTFQESKNKFFAEKHKNFELPDNYMEQIETLIHRYIETVDIELVSQEQVMLGHQ